MWEFWDHTTKGSGSNPTVMRIYHDSAMGSHDIFLTYYQSLWSWLHTWHIINVYDIL